LHDGPLEFDAKAAKLLTEDTLPMLVALTSHLREASYWNNEILEATVRSFADGEGLKLGKTAQPLRAALTGRAVSPGVFDVLVTLGRDLSLARLDAAAARAG
jgi:glutamyl-tRNA synthetase